MKWFKETYNYLLPHEVFHLPINESNAKICDVRAADSNGKELGLLRLFSRRIGFGPVMQYITPQIVLLYTTQTLLLL